MEKLYIVETQYSLTWTRRHFHTDASSAQEAVDLAREHLGDNYEILNVFEETNEIWE